MSQIWDLWFPKGGATGISFCRSRIADDVGNTVLVHAAPPELDVTIRDQEGHMVAQGMGLVRDQPGPMSFLHREGTSVKLSDDRAELRDNRAEARDDRAEARDRSLGKGCSIH